MTSIAAGTRIEVWCDGGGRHEHPLQEGTTEPISRHIETFEYADVPWPRIPGLEPRPPHYTWQTVGERERESRTRRNRRQAAEAGLEGLERLAFVLQHDEPLVCRCGMLIRTNRLNGLDAILDRLGLAGVSRIPLGRLASSID